MIELPEALSLAGQIASVLVGRTVERVLPPSKAHKFCWYTGDPIAYQQALAGEKITGAEGFGIYVDLLFSGGLRLSINDGVNLRLMEKRQAPAAYQLILELDGGEALVFTVAMYGGICLHGDGWENEYYEKSRGALSPFDPAFGAYFRETMAACKPTLGAKGFLATQQRFPGLGNGVLQDILLRARVHPKRKIGSLWETEREALLAALTATLGEMAKKGGRDTEKDLYGNPGGYHTLMCRNTLVTGCPLCGGPVQKEIYLGGAVYVCPACQPLPGDK